MVWLKMSDTFANHPIVLGVIEHPDADERSIDEVAGYMTRLATLAAQNATDYVANYGTAVTLAGSVERAERLLTLAQFAGYGHMVLDSSGRKLFRLVDDPEFIHMKTAEEIAWEKQRKADNSNPHITVLVRLRDGDACRYCGIIVRFEGVRKGKLAGTYDHRPPGRPATAESAVVCCTECNSKRGGVGRNEPTPKAALAAADKLVPLRPAPATPYYHAGTRAWFQRHVKILEQYDLQPPPVVSSERDLKWGTPAPGTDTAPATDAGVRPVPVEQPPDTAPAHRGSVRSGGDPGEPAVPATAPNSGVRAGSGQPEGTALPPEDVRPDSPHESDPADSGRSQQIPGVPDLDLAGRVGSGRDGPVRREAERSAAPHQSPSSRKRKRRGRRRPSKPNPDQNQKVKDDERGSDV